MLKASTTQKALSGSLTGRLGFWRSDVSSPSLVWDSWFYRAMLRRARLCHSMSSVRLSVRLSVTFRYPDHIGWNTSKIISRLISLRFMLGLPHHWRSGATGTPPKLRWNRDGAMSAKTCNISETVQDRTKVTETD